MKNILFTFLMMVVLTSCSKSQDSNLENWTSIQYHYSAGPLPPPYHYSYQINVNKDGVSFINYHLGYDNDYPSLKYDFTVSADDIKLLEEKICKSKLLSGKVESVPENAHPIGGSLNRVRLTITNPNPDLDQPPQVIESPYFPKEEFINDLQELYDFINKLVPGEVWLEINGKKTEYETNRKYK